jgi:hypothetical protein
MGSTLSESGASGKAGAVHYRCPAGVDLPALVAAQRVDLRRGEPLKPAAAETPSAG